MSGSAPWRVDVDPTAWVAPGAVLVGSVRLGAYASVWYGAVLRGDGDLIDIAERTNVQDGSVLHADPGHPLRLGRGVSIGHRAVLHGCTVGDDTLVGMGAIVMNDAVIGHGSIIGAGAVLAAGTVVPPGSLVMGLPGGIRRPVNEDERAGITANAEYYLQLVAAHRGR